MNFKLLMLSALLIVNTTMIKADNDFSLAVELENDTLDISDHNLSKGPDDSRYYFWVKAIITNESISPKKLTTWSCFGFGFHVESDSVRTAVKCRKNYPKIILLQPNKTYDIPLYLSFKKNYTGNTLKFKIRNCQISYDGCVGWSKFVTINLRRK